MHFRLRECADDGDVLIGRTAGEEARAILERAIREAGESDPVALDFEGVRAITVSFAESFFVPLLAGRLKGYHENHPIVLLGVVAEVAETIDLVLKTRSMSVLAISESGAQLLGGDDALEETARLAYELGEFSTPKLADQLGITVPAANNRLRELVRRGALIRTPGYAPSGGRQYLYRVPVIAGRPSRPRVAAPKKRAAKKASRAVPA